MATKEKFNRNELIPVESQKILDEIIKEFESVKEIKIENHEQYDNIAALVKNVKRGVKELEDERKSLVKPYKDKSSYIDAEFKKVRDPLNDIEKKIKFAMGKWVRDQEMKRIEVQLKREAEAEEARRKAEEKAAKERKKEEEYRNSGREDLADKAAARAATSETVAENHVAEIVEDTTKKKGVSTKKVYKVAVSDFNLAVNSCLTNSMLTNFVTINIPGIEGIVNKLKGQVGDIPGLRITEDVAIAIRA